MAARVMNINRWSLRRVNAGNQHAANYVFAKALPWSCVLMPMQAFQDQLDDQLRLRKGIWDMLGHEGYPVIDGDRKALITGADFTANLFEDLTGFHPRIIRVPVRSHLVHLQ